MKLAEFVTSDALQQPAYVLTQPLLLEFSDDVQVRIINVLRFLPAQRLVLQGDWQGREVVFKLFLGAKHQRRYQREYQGYQYLTSAKIPTPELLLANTESTFSCLLYRYLSDSVTLAQALLQQKDSSDDFHKAIVLLALMHERGLVQDDMHLDNFLVQGDVVFVIDNDGVRRQTKIAAQRDNLLSFFAQVLPKHQDMLQQYLPHYLQARGGDWSLRSARKQLQRLSSKRLHSYREKMLRQCTEFHEYNTGTCYAMLHNGPDKDLWLANLDNLDSLIETGEKLKLGNSATVAKVDLAGKSWVIKRYNIKSNWHKLRRLLGVSRARIAWQGGLSLRFAGAATPAPIAMVEQRWGPFQGIAYLVTAYVQADDLAQVNDVASAEQAAPKVSAWFNLLLQCQLSHGDCKASNLFLAETELMAIDLDAMTWHRKMPSLLRALRKDIGRLLKNWDNAPEIQAVFVRELRTLEQQQRLKLLT